MSRIKKKACPEVHLLEAYVSKQIPPGSDRRKIAHHIKSCPRCYALSIEFNQYYAILEREKKKPVLHSVFRLIDNIEKNNVVIAGILLQPNDIKESSQSIQYQAEIVLITNDNGSIDLNDLECIPIDENEIFIRAIQSLETNKTTLFLYANDEKLYRNVQLQIESSSKIFISNEIGKIELGRFDINNLDEQGIIITTEHS
jgi:hypothetical protein